MEETRRRGVEKTGPYFGSLSSVFCTPRLLHLLHLLLLLFAGRAFAAPPTIDARPALGDALVQGHWQPLLITLKNPDTGAAMQGEVQVALQEARSGRGLGTFTAPMILPRGAGDARVPVLVSIPERTQLEIQVFVVNGRGGKGEVVTYKTFDKIPVRMDPLVLVAVSQTPDALGYLSGEGVGVYQANGVLRPATQPRQKGGYRAPNSEEAAPLRVQQVTDPADLPESAVGYDVAGMVYIGPDIPPDALSDTQTDALRRWVAGGGCLVVSGDKLRASERFRTWTPPAPVSPGKAAPFAVARYGRGAVLTLGFDPSAPGFAESHQKVSVWRAIARAGVAAPSVGASVADRESGYYGYRANSGFLDSVMHAPGLRAPGIEAIGIFLLVYLVLVAPVNYLILKRLGRRELAWLTIPLLVALFSLGAYFFGLQTKGSQTVQNTATVIELGEGTGDGLAHGAVGLFSPSRTRYSIRVETPDAVLWSSDGNFVLSEGEKTGATLRNAEVSMWAMRSFGTRTATLPLGQGIRADLNRKRGPISGTIENQTGVRLTQIRIAGPASQAVIATLEPGEKATVTLDAVEYDLTGKPGGGRLIPEFDYRETPTPESTRQAIQAGVVQAIQENDAVVIRQQKKGKDQVLISAWNGDALLPVTVNGEKAANGSNVNLILTTTTVR